jgi:hypothetical protein
VVSLILLSERWGCPKGGWPMVYQSSLGTRDIYEELLETIVGNTQMYNW